MRAIRESSVTNIWGGSLGRKYTHFNDKTLLGTPRQSKYCNRLLQSIAWQWVCRADVGSLSKIENILQIGFRFIAPNAVFFRPACIDESCRLFTIILYTA